MNSENYWRWFITSEKELAKSRSSRDIGGRIYDALILIDRRLGVEVSDYNSSGVREVIISANGFRELFELVDDLVDSAPKLSGWQFVALKPARGFHFIYRQEELSLSPSKWHFLVLRDQDGHLGIRVFIPGQRTIISAAVLQTIIETGVGERSFSDINHLEYTQNQDSLSHGTWLVLTSLPDYLDWQRGK